MLLILFFIYIASNIFAYLQVVSQKLRTIQYYNLSIFFCPRAIFLNTSCDQICPGQNWGYIAQLIFLNLQIPMINTIKAFAQNWIHVESAFCYCYSEDDIRSKIYPYVCPWTLSVPWSSSRPSKKTLRIEEQIYNVPGQIFVHILVPDGSHC